LIPTRNRDAIREVREELRAAERSEHAPRARVERDQFQLGLIRSAGLTEQWQFLNLVPQQMMNPVPRKTTPGRVRLADDGRNIAEYLEEIRKLNSAAFDGVVEALKVVVPFMSEVRAESASIVEKSVYLTLIEPGLVKKESSETRQRQQVPGWMMSTGTLRALAVLAALRHPEPPSLLVVEEIENSLDPRTLGLVMEEIRRAVKSGRTQVILTTHSPQLLDLALLEHIVLVQRDERGEPMFRRPAQIEEVRQWAQTFSPGQMFTRDLYRQLSRK